MTFEQKAQLRRLAFLIALIAMAAAAVVRADELALLELVPEN